jgi:hypothetical protein
VERYVTSDSLGTSPFAVNYGKFTIERTSMSGLRTDLYDELLAVVRARDELAPGHDEQLVESFLEQLDREIDKRIAARKPPRISSRAIVSIVALLLALPLTIVAAFAGWQAVAVTWLAIVVIIYLVDRR